MVIRGATQTRNGMETKQVGCSELEKHAKFFYSQD